MAEQESRPTSEEPADQPETAHPSKPTLSRKLLPFALGLILLLVGCFWWANDPADPEDQSSNPTAIVSNSSGSNRSQQANAALTRVAASLAQSQATQVAPTATPTPVAAVSALVPLPTVTPTQVPLPLPTRTVEVNGEATLRLQLNNDTFESNGQPITIALEPRAYLLGNDILSQSDEWCEQVGPTGLVFDLTYTLQHITEDLRVTGEIRLYDGFCGEWGRLGNVLSTIPMDVTVPVGTSAILAPTLHVQGAFFGMPNVLDISTGVYLELIFRNPLPR